jgi:hypothetical protein
MIVAYNGNVVKNKHGLFFQKRLREWCSSYSEENFRLNVSPAMVMYTPKLISSFLILGSAAGDLV